jgi:hypothetical protein
MARVRKPDGERTFAGTRGNDGVAPRASDCNDTGAAMGGLPTFANRFGQCVNAYLATPNAISRGREQAAGPTSLSTEDDGAGVPS